MLINDRTKTAILVQTRVANFSDQNAGGSEGNAGSGDAGAGDAGTQGTSQNNSGTNWEAAYKTLQQTHNALKQKADRLEGQNVTLSNDLATRANDITALQKQVQDFTTHVEGLTTQINTITGERDNLSAQIGRTNLIMGEFPNLAQFEAQGLLPQAEGDEALREVLTKFSAAIQGLQTSAIEGVLEGASPEGVGAEGEGQAPTLTLDQAWDAVNEASKKGDDVAYEKAYQTYLDILNSESEEA